MGWHFILYGTLQVGGGESAMHWKGLHREGCNAQENTCACCGCVTHTIPYRPSRRVQDLERQLAEMEESEHVIHVAEVPCVT